LPGGPPYRGPIDLPALDRALAQRRFDLGGMAWLRGFDRLRAAGG
jgi:hypothetical protein